VSVRLHEGAARTIVGTAEAAEAIKGGVVGTLSSCAVKNATAAATTGGRREYTDMAAEAGGIVMCKTWCRLIAAVCIGKFRLRRKLLIKDDKSNVSRPDFQSNYSLKPDRLRSLGFSCIPSDRKRSGLRE
jgi:hypothetical protein